MGGRCQEARVSKEGRRREVDGEESEYKKDGKEGRKHIFFLYLVFTHNPRCYLSVGRY
jgi:hypothetical protein